MSSLQQAYMHPPPDGNRSTGTSILIITFLFTGISTIVVSLKIWTRLKIIRQFGADDVLTILALVRALSHTHLHRTETDLPGWKSYSS